MEHKKLSFAHNFLFASLRLKFHLPINQKERIGEGEGGHNNKLQLQNSSDKKKLGVSIGSIKAHAVCISMQHKIFKKC